MKMAINSTAKESSTATIANKMVISWEIANSSMNITKDSKIIDLKVQISKLEKINSSKEIKISICKEEIINSIKTEVKIVLTAIDSQDLKKALLMITNKQMIIGVIIKVKMGGMMIVEILVNKIKMYLRLMKINFKNQMIMNGIKVLKNRIVYKKVVRNRNF